MTDNETQPFDQAEADDLRNAFWVAFETSWKSNPHNNHNNAQQGLEAVIARLASRQPAPVVGEAELAEIIYRNRKSGTIYGRLPDGSVGKYPWEDVNHDRWVRTPDCVAETRDAASEIASRLAARAGQVPEWVKEVRIHMYGTPSEDTGVIRRLDGEGANLDDALRAAIERAKGGQE